MNETQNSQEDEETMVVENAKNLRCAAFQAARNDETPRVYYENTSKEELVLEHVLEYKRNYKIMYDPDRKLLLAPKNECGIRKFICTTIRPTKLPFVELYDYEKDPLETANVVDEKSYQGLAADLSEKMTTFFAGQRAAARPNL